MAGLEELRAKIETARSLHSVVKTMKALAAASISHFQEAVDSLSEYHRTVELGFQVAVNNRPTGLRIFSEETGSRVGLIIIGSDQGLCGQFNEEIARYATRRIVQEKIEPNDHKLFAVGARVVFPLERYGLKIDDLLMIPASVSGVASLVQNMLLEIDRWYAELSIRRFLIFHNRPISRSAYEPHTVKVLPLDREWLESLAARPWESRSLPAFRVDWEALFSHLVRQHLLVSLYRAATESLAAENASRLASMQSAERNIEERLEQLRQRYNKERQDAITAELLDIVGGFEALTKETAESM